MENTLKIAAVFGGARITEEAYIEAEGVGKVLALKGYAVKTGGYGGVMEAAAKGAKEAGCELIIGHTCRTFPTAEGNQYLTFTRPGVDLYERLKFMIQDTNVFVIMPGGIGTIAELFLVMDIARKKKKNAPKIILVGDVWKGIVDATKVLLTYGETDTLTVVGSYTELESLV